MINYSLYHSLQFKYIMELPLIYSFVFVISLYISPPLYNQFVIKLQLKKLNSQLLVLFPLSLKKGDKKGAHFRIVLPQAANERTAWLAAHRFPNSKYEMKLFFIYLDSLNGRSELARATTRHHELKYFRIE